MVINKREKKIMDVVWYLDSSCLRHMTCDKSFLMDYIEEEGRTITFGDNAKGYTKVHGKFCIRHVKLQGVSYGDGLKHNLFSISQLCDIKKNSDLILKKSRQTASLVMLFLGQD